MPASPNAAPSDTQVPYENEGQGSSSGQYAYPTIALYQGYDNQDTSDGGSALGAGASPAAECGECPILESLLGWRAGELRKLRSLDSRDSRDTVLLASDGIPVQRTRSLQHQSSVIIFHITTCPGERDRVRVRAGLLCCSSASEPLHSATSQTAW